MSYIATLSYECAAAMMPRLSVPMQRAVERGLTSLHGSDHHHHAVPQPLHHHRSAHISHAFISPHHLQKKIC
eukprot:1161462-Pelagomonas_calceolata.AAC.7